MSDEEIDALEDPASWDGIFSERIRSALSLADAMCGDTHTLTDDLIDDVRSHFSDLELAEILLVCGQANLNNRVGNMAKQIVNFEVD